MSNFTCPTCGLTNIDCGKAGYKTAREIELEKKLEIAIKALEKMVNYNSVAEQVDKYYYIVLDVREIGKKALKKIEK
jgi:hypothetical protein